MILFLIDSQSQWGIQAEGADTIASQSDDDSSKNAENGVRWMALVAGNVGEERPDGEGDTGGNKAV